MTSSISRAALAAVVLSSASLASEPWDGVPFSAAPAELLAAANRQPPPADADIDLLFEESAFTLDSQSRMAMRHRLVYRVLTQKGADEWSQTEAAWRPWFQARPEIRARVIRADGQVHELDPATIAEQGSSEGDAQTYSDMRQLRGPLPAMAPGAVVEEQVTLKDTAPFFDAGALWWAPVGRQIPVRHVRVVVEAPAPLPLRYVARGGIAAPKERLDGGLRTVTFEAGPLKALEDPEPFAPPDSAPRPSLFFTTVRSWADVAQAYSKIVDRQIAAGDLPAVSKAVLGDKPVPKDQVLARALSWMRDNLRYTGVEFGDAAIVPRPPSEVLRRKYGDCKDLATFLVALLRSQGLDANVALLRTRWDDVSELPGVAFFDHAIVRMGGRSPKWIDTTSSVHPAGLLPAPDQDRLALVAAPSSSALTRTPASSSAESVLRITRELHLAERGDPSVREQRQGTGLVGAGLRGNALDRDAGDLKETWARYAKSFYGAEALDSFSESPVDAVESPFVISFEAKGGRLVSTDESGTAVVLDPASLFSWMPRVLTDRPDEDAQAAAKKDPENQKRKSDFLLLEPYQGELAFRVVPPPAYSVRPLPEAASLSLGPVTFSSRFAMEKDGAVVATYRLDAPKRRWSAAEYDAFLAAYRRWADEPADRVAFEQDGQAHLAAGRVKEALEVFRKVAALHPKEALHEEQIARALLEAGLGDEARVHARRAVALEPKSAEAQTTLGWVLQHDALGRRFRRGFDLDGALAAYRKAKELGGGFGPRADLAILLEHTADGVRYGPGSRLDEAIAEYRGLRKELDRQDLDENLLYALMWARHFKELVAAADEVAESPSRNAFKLVGVAANSGAEAAVREAERLSRSADARRTVLSTAGERLLLLRQYREAEALLREAAKGSASAAQLQTRLSVIGRMRRSEELNLEAKDPQTSALKMVRATLSPAVAPEDLGRFFSQRLLAHASAKAIGEGMLEGMSRTFRRDSRVGDWAAFATDAAMAAMQLSVDGDDALGYRIRISAPLVGGTQETWFMVKEGGEYRLVGAGRTPGALALVAQDLAEHGDLEHARRWLDWMRDAGACAQSDGPWRGFCALWPESRGGRKEALLAAAAGAAFIAPSQAIPVLAKARAAAPKELATTLDWALMPAYIGGEKWAELESDADRLLAAEPESARALTVKVVALLAEEKLVPLQKLLEARIAAHPDEHDHDDQLMEAYFRNGDYQKGAALADKLVASGEASANTYNELAWAALFQPPLRDRDVEYAQRSVAMSRSQVEAYLHTLATIYAETGKVVEARQTLLQAVDLRPSGDPNPADWYVLGRIAEGYGLPDAARRAYEKALSTKVPPSKPFTVESLAKARIDRLPAAVANLPAP